MRLPKKITVARENWVRMMYCMKHLMTLHPEYKSMIEPFYKELYEKYPYNEEDPFDFGDDGARLTRPKTSIERHLDDLTDLNSKEKEEQKQIFESQLNQLVWDLGLKLPSWDNKGKDHDKK